MSQNISHRGMKMTRRGRVVLLLFAALLFGVVAVLVPGALSAATADSPSEPVRVGVVTVERGQTMWHVASAITESGDDVRDSVAVLLDLNNLGSVDVLVGQQLLVPVA